jgi:hypothetical protein
MGRLGISNSPDDDVQEIVLSTYTRVTPDGGMDDILDAAGMVIPRESISHIERLIYEVEEVHGHATLVRPDNRQRST